MRARAEAPEVNATLGVLEENRKKAISRLNSYLETSREAILREHQVDVMEAVRNSLDRGETAGFIVLPSGTGKTVLFSEIATVLGIKTVVLSPTKTILRQSSDTVRRFYPDADVSDYYQENKDASGKIIHTTYQSFARLLDMGIINPADIDLLICDEGHVALGEQRHKVFRRLPNALMLGFTATPDFRQVDNFIARGMAGENERWLELFQNQIHEMGLQEAIVRGLLSPLHVYMVRTSSVVDDIEIRAGEYNKAQLERYLNIHARNYLTVGIIAGPDRIPPEVRLSPGEKEEIARIHEEIKGKRTAIFGISVEHIKKLEEMLKAEGINAKAVHGHTQEDVRNDAFSKHTEGKI